MDTILPLDLVCANIWLKQQHWPFLSGVLNAPPFDALPEEESRPPEPHCTPYDTLTPEGIAETSEEVPMNSKNTYLSTLREFQQLLSDPWNPELYPHRAALLWQHYGDTLEPGKPTTLEDMNDQWDYEYQCIGGGSQFRNVPLEDSNLLRYQYLPECQTCQIQGHFTHQCDMNKGKTWWRCYNCGAKGHETQDCPVECNEALQRRQRWESRKDCKAVRQIMRMYKKAETYWAREGTQSQNYQGLSHQAWAQEKHLMQRQLDESRGICTYCWRQGHAEWHCYEKKPWLLKRKHKQKRSEQQQGHETKWNLQSENWEEETMHICHTVIKEEPTLCIRKTKSAVYTPFLFKLAGKIECALIDSSASHNFIDPQTVKCLGVQLTRLENPVKVLNMDGSQNTAGTVNSFTTLTMKLRTETRNLWFYMAKLGEDCAIFGFPFLRAFNLTIDWRTGRIRHKGGITLLQEGEMTVKRLKLEALKQCSIPLPGHAIYMRCASFVQQWTAAAEKSQDHLMEATLPPEYQHHEHVFDQNLAAHFPLSWKENFSIQLKPGAPDSVADGWAGLFRCFCDNFLNKLCKIMKIIMEVG
jgi:hypothetical protein